MTGTRAGKFALALLCWLFLSPQARTEEHSAGHAAMGCVPAHPPCLAALPHEAADDFLIPNWLLTGDEPADSDGQKDDLQVSPQEQQPTPPGNPVGAQTSGPAPAAKSAEGPPIQPKQPKRILGVMPNFRAVSAGEQPAPPTLKESFMLATQNSFDYSSFIFVGFTSAIAEWTDTHPQLGQGMPGYGRYYWRGFVDKTDGNYWVLFILPTVFHQDERYFTLGKGGFWKRCGYAASRVIITPNYEGHDSFNISELMGRGIAQAISVTYYPSRSQTASAIASKYGYAILRDALTNVFREFWPDISSHVLHRHHSSPDSTSP